jgi:tetratricopeptide (TPR) repeat protein
VIIGGIVAVSKDFPTGKRILRGKFSYQACSNQVCVFPAEVDIDISVEVVGSDQPVHQINREIFSQLEAMRAEAHYDLGKRYQEEGLLDKAIGECEEAIKLKPDNPHYLSTLAELYYEIGNYDKAIATIKKAIALTPEDDFLQRQLKKFREVDDRSH